MIVLFAVALALWQIVGEVCSSEYARNRNHQVGSCGNYFNNFWVIPEYF